MAQFALCTLLLVYCSLVVAKPVNIHARAVTPSILGNISLFEQYSAAAYCPSNNDGPATLNNTKRITCPISKNCPTVESHNATAIAEFQNLENPISDTTGFVALDTNIDAIVASFRGTISLVNSVTNLEITQIPAGIDGCDGCLTEQGFSNDWKAASKIVTSAVADARARYPHYRIVITGHSLGAAVATICAAVLRGTYDSVDLYTYGSPMVGNAAFATFVTNQGASQNSTQRNYRVTHANDIVPNVPSYALGFRHVSPQYWIIAGNNQTVTVDDIQVSTGIEDQKGDSYTLLELFETSVDAHVWYFNPNGEKTSSCFPGGMELYK